MRCAPDLERSRPSTTRMRVKFGRVRFVATYAPLELALSRRPKLGSFDSTYSVTHTSSVWRMPQRCSITTSHFVYAVKRDTIRARANTQLFVAETILCRAVPKSRAE